MGTIRWTPVSLDVPSAATIQDEKSIKLELRPGLALLRYYHASGVVRTYVRGSVSEIPARSCALLLCFWVYNNGPDISDKSAHGTTEEILGAREVIVCDDF